MVYFKIMDGDQITTVEAFEEPIYVHKQVDNEIVAICPRRKAEGILSLDRTQIYRLSGKESDSFKDCLVAVSIYEAEYSTIKMELDK